MRWGPRIAVVALVPSVVLYLHWNAAPQLVVAYVELKSHIDRRVEFVGVFDGDDKGYDLIVFQGNPILFQHTQGSWNWSPDTGGRCKVVGTLKAYDRHLSGVEQKVDYALIEAEYFQVHAQAVVAVNR